MFTELTNLLQAIHTPAYFFDMETHRLIAVNAHMAGLLDYTEAELLAMRVEDFRPPEDVAKLQRALRQGTPQGAVEWRYLSRAGALLYVQLSYRDSVFFDKIAGRTLDVRLVVLSKWDTQPTRSADELFG